MKYHKLITIPFVDTANRVIRKLFAKRKWNERTKSVLILFRTRCYTCPNDTSMSKSIVVWIRRILRIFRKCIGIGNIRKAKARACNKRGLF